MVSIGVWDEGDGYREHLVVELERCDICAAYVDDVIKHAVWHDSFRPPKHFVVNELNEAIDMGVDER